MRDYAHMEINEQNTDSFRSSKPLTIDQFAQALGVCRRPVYELIAQRKVRSYKIGRLRRIPPSELEDFPDRQLQEAEA